MRRALTIALSIVGVVLLLLAGLFGALQTGYARDRLRMWIADATAGTSTQVQLEAIEGLVPFDMQLLGIRLSDRDGTWLAADRIRIAWSPQSLLAGSLQVDELAAGTIDLMRIPVAERAQQPQPTGPLIPELPVAIDLRDLSVERLALAAPILGEPAALSLQAKARLGDVGDGLSASLNLRQLSGQTGTATVDLAYRPKDDFLSLTGKVDEPRGGVLGHLLGLPQGSDLQVALDGQGPLAAWRGRLNANLAGKPLLDLSAEITGHEPRRIAFSLRGMPDPLLPEDLRPLVAGGIDAKGAVEITPGGDAVKVSEFSASAPAGTVSASGILGLRGPGDLTLNVTAPQSQPFAMLVPDVAWSGATLQARLQGVIDRPHIGGNLAVQSLSVADMRVGPSKLTLDASAEQGFEQPIGIRADLQAADISAADPRVTALLAHGLHLTLAGRADKAGTLVAESVQLQTGGITLSGSGRAERWGAAARQADATLTVADIAAVANPFGLPGSGAADIALKLAPASTGEQLELTGTARGLSIGQPIVDRLLGPSPTIHLALEGNLPQSVTIKAARLAGAKARLDAQGAIADRNLDLTFMANLDEAADIDPALGGQIAADGAISGTIDAPLATAELTSPVLTIAGRRLEQVQLNTKAVDLLANPKIDLDGTARLYGMPGRVSSSVVIEPERIAASNLALTVGTSKLTGDVAMANRLLTGKLALSAPDLREVGQLAGTAMNGDLSATLQLDSAKGQQRASLSATGRGIGVADVLQTASLDLNATAENLLGRPSIAADLNLRNPVIAGQSLTTASLTANGPLSGLQTRLSLTGADLNAAVAAELGKVADGYRIGVQTLTADVKNIQVKNKEPATIEVGSKATRIDNLALQVADGSLQLGGTLTPKDMKLSGTMKSMPLSLARAFAPDIPITGRLDGEVEVNGKPTAPSGRFSIAGTNIGATDVPEQQADLQIAGRLQEGRLDMSGSVKPKGGGSLTFTAALPSLSPDARLQAEAKGTFDLVLVDAFLAGGADRVRGKADIDITAAGQLSAPELKGRLRLVDSSYENLLYGIKLRQIEADVLADGPHIRLASLTATTPGGGRVTGEGEVNLANGVETALRIQMRKASVFDTELATAIVDSDLTITGTPQSRLNLGGSMKVLKADIRVPDQLPPSVQEIAVKEINAPPEKAARVAQIQQPPKQTLIVGLDLSVDAPQQVAVRGRGLDVELGGRVHVRGTTNKPEIEGAFRLLRGSLEIAGKRMDFTEGKLTFEGGERINPLLDLTAVTRAQDLQVTAKVEGPASSPRITLSSVPTMPEDEILARLLFGKSAGALSPFELLQIAEATADLAGVNAGPDVLDKIRKSTGLDRLSVEQTEGGTGPSLSAGRYVSKGVYVGVSQGARSGTSAATVEIEVTPNVKIETEIGSNAAGKAGVNLEWDY